MDDYSFLVPDIESEYKKFHDNLKKKYPKIKEATEAALREIDSLKLIIPSKDDENAIANFKTELNKSIGNLLKPIYLVIENKNNKLYLSTLNLLKKFIIYNLINDSEYSNIINYLRDIFSFNNEDIQLKVLEILQYIINGNVVKLTNININNIMSICKIDNIKGHTKYTECKNAIKLILSILVKKIFDITEEKDVIIFIQSLLDNIDGTQKEWTTMTTQNSLIKSIRIELISSILETFPEKFREGEMNKYLEERLIPFIKKITQINNDTLIGIKICRLIMIIVTVVNKSHIIIEEILKYLNKTTQIKWQQILILEILGELFKKPEILFEIYTTNLNLYQNIFKTFTNITYNIIILKSQKSTDKKIPPTSSSSTKNVIPNNKKQNEHNHQLVIIPNKKYILNNSIFLNENDQIMNISTSIEYIFKLLKECYVHLKNSYIFLMEKNGLNINISSEKKINANEPIKLNENQEKIKEMINFNFIDFKGGVIGLLININEISTAQIFINILQSFIYIYTSFGLYSSRDELLNDLCKLALPNNLENILEIKEKNILIIRTIFNLSHCTNLFSKNSWLIFIQTVQNLYFILIKSGYYLYNDKQQFDIEIIMKNIESNIKKYSMESSIYEVQKVVQEDEVNKNINTITTSLPQNKDVKHKKGKHMSFSKSIRILTGEEKENIDIISNTVNNLFTDTNDYEDNTLIDIINALYEDIEKKIIFYNKQLKSFYNNRNNALNTENKRKNSEGEIQEKKDDLIPNKKNIGKLTVRNEMYKSVMGTMAGGGAHETQNFNRNFQNEKILINLSNVNFNLVKILSIVIININRINLLWDKILSLVKLFAFELNEENNFSNTILKFNCDLLGYIIINILIKYKNIKIDEKDEKSIFNVKNYQDSIFIPPINLLNGYYNNFHINPSYMINPFKNIVEKCGTKLNINGWNHIFEGINLILDNKIYIINLQEKELLFKIIEQIFNEYSDYLSIFNIETLIEVLEKFSINSEDKNLCYSSISFFWQCADIIDNYQKDKKEINGFELDTFKEKIPNNENKIKFYENIWKKLFGKLINMNNDKRFDIKKSGINLFTQFFVAKFKSLNEINNMPLYLINNIFLKVFNDNIQSFLSDKIDNKENEINTNIINNEKETDNNQNENEENTSLDVKEEIVLFSLQNMGKIIKIYIEEQKNKNKDNNKKEIIEILEKLSMIYVQLIEKKNTPQISVNVLKNIGDFESADKVLFQENRHMFWDIIEKLINYISDKELFIEQYSKSVKGSKVIQSIIESLISFFYSKEDIEILNDKSTINNNIDSLLEIIPKLFKSTDIMEKTLINIDPYNVIKTEKNIFELIEAIGSYCNNLKDVKNIIDYLLKIINYNKEDIHCIAISGQSMKSLGSIIYNNAKVVNDIEEEYIKNIVLECKDKIKIFYEIKKERELVGNLAKHDIKKNDQFVWEKMILCFNDYTLKALIYKIKDEGIWNDIIDYLGKIYLDIKKDSNNNNEINEGDIDTQNEIIKSNKNIEKNIINFIINILLPNAGYISNNIQVKILQLLELKNEENSDKNEPELFSVNQLNTENLFNLCNYKDESDILKEFNNELNIKDEDETKINSIKKYIEIKKNISKKTLPVLFKICKDKINEYLENEKKESNNKNMKDEIIMILDGLKKLDSYCSELNDMPKNDILKICINNKKGHLFILHRYFNKLIFSKDEEVKNKIYEIFEVISNEMDLEE